MQPSDEMKALREKQARCDHYWQPFKAGARFYYFCSKCGLERREPADDSLAHPKIDMGTVAVTKAAYKRREGYVINGIAMMHPKLRTRCLIDRLGYVVHFDEQGKAFSAQEPVAPWRGQQAAIDAKALATAQEIALMWGADMSQFVSRIQVAVIDAMRWMQAGTAIPQGERVARALGEIRWRSIAEDGPPEPEVFVLCWDGKQTFTDWFGSKPDGGRGITHWLPFPDPPGSLTPMYDMQRALKEQP